MRKASVLLLLLLAAGATAAWAKGGMMKKKVPPYEFGSVTMNNFSRAAGMPEVVFDHWVHRQYYTCRLCHVDIGFGMSANSTKVRAVDNMKGYFCGTCHNGGIQQGKKLFSACASDYSREDFKQCTRCHGMEKSTAREDAFFRFAGKMPKENLGNGINWEKAEADRLIKISDHLEGVSIKKSPFKNQKDFAIKAKTEGMPEIIFSHTKHTVWNGCELCHPDIFVGVKKGTSKYSMVELFDGKYCGVCHDKVAFPQTDCQRCHTRQIGG